MAVRTTVDLPEPLHDRLRDRAERSGTSIRSLIVRALEDTYAEPRKRKPVTGPLITTKGKRGLASPSTRIPMTLLFTAGGPGLDFQTWDSRPSRS